MNNQVNAQSEEYYERAKKLYKEGQLKQAISLLEQLYEQYPNNQDIARLMLKAKDQRNSQLSVAKIRRGFWLFVTNKITIAVIVCIMLSYAIYYAFIEFSPYTPISYLTFQPQISLNEKIHAEVNVGSDKTRGFPLKSSLTGNIGYINTLFGNDIRVGLDFGENKPVFDVTTKIEIYGIVTNHTPEGFEVQVDKYKVLSTCTLMDCSP